MYPKNAASPERIAIGPVVLIADGTVQTSGVTVRILPFGGSEADGVGTTAYSTDGVVVYTPTQAETNYTSFILIAKKSACIPASVTVVTSARSVSGEVQVGGYASGQAPPTLAQIVTGVLEGDIDAHDHVAQSLAKYISIIKKSNTVIDGEVTNAAIPTTTTFTSNVAYPTGAFKHAVLLWLTGSLAEQNSPILTYNNTNGAIVVEEAFTQAPTVGDQFIIIPSTHVHSVAAIADGVWDEPLSGHLGSGSTGEALNNSGGSGNPWITDIATGYTGTQAGNILNQVKAKTDLITSGTAIQTTIPVTAQGQITGPLYIGDDYLTANGRQFDWTVALPSGFVAATATCKFGMIYEDETGASTFNVSGTVTDVGSGNVRLRFEVPKATTGTLKAGFYRWSVEIASAGGTEITRVAYADRKLVEWREKQT